MLQSLRDQPGTQREYETIYVLRPDSDSEQVQTVNARIRKVIDEAEGKLLRIENWGKRKLAYEINKEHKGIYLYWRYLAEPFVVSEVERNLRLLDTVIRFLTVKIDQDVDPTARPTDVTDVVFTAAAETRPDEEDYYLGRAHSRSDGDEEGESGDADKKAAAPEGASDEAKAEGAVDGAEAKAEGAEAKAEGAEAKAEGAEAKAEGAAEPAEASADAPQAEQAASSDEAGAPAAEKPAEEPAKSAETDKKPVDGDESKED